MVLKRVLMGGAGVMVSLLPMAAVAATAQPGVAGAEPNAVTLCVPTPSDDDDNNREEREEPRR